MEIEGPARMKVGVWGFVPAARAGGALRGRRADCGKRAGGLIISSTQNGRFTGPLTGLCDGPQKNNTVRGGTAETFN